MYTEIYGQRKVFNLWTGVLRVKEDPCSPTSTLTRSRGRTVSGVVRDNRD